MSAGQQIITIFVDTVGIIMSEFINALFSALVVPFFESLSDLMFASQSAA